MNTKVFKSYSAISTTSSLHLRSRTTLLTKSLFTEVGRFKSKEEIGSLATQTENRQSQGGALQMLNTLIITDASCG